MQQIQPDELPYANYLIIRESEGTIKSSGLVYVIVSISPAITAERELVVGIGDHAYGAYADAVARAKGLIDANT